MASDTDWVIIICGSEVKPTFLLRPVPRSAPLAQNRMRMLDHVIGQSPRISQDPILTYGTRVDSVDMFFERGCRRADKMANDALRARRMLRSRVCLQTRLSFKFFIAKLAEYSTFAARVGSDTLVTRRLGTLRSNDSWTRTSVRR